MNLLEKIACAQKAPNMVEIEGLLSSVTSDYLTRYANEIEKAPTAKIYGEQSKWISNAVRFFIADIHRDKLAIWKNVPDRFKTTAIYKRLQLSQFITMHHA